MLRKQLKCGLTALAVAAAFLLTGLRVTAVDLAGNVRGAGSPIVGSTMAGITKRNIP